MYSDLTHRLPCALAWAIAAVVLASGSARADVTVQEQSTFDLSLVKARGTSTEYTTSDKQRRDSNLHCEGMMSLLCGNLGASEITRLDKDLVWTLVSKKKEYTEAHFPTPAERQAMEDKMKAALEKMKQCPAHQASDAPDPSKCQMSPPKIDARQTDKHATIAGHDTQMSELTLSESCHDASTNDTCEFRIILESWLTQDEIAGIADRKAFMQAHMQKLGLTDPDSSTQKMLQQFLAPYQDSLKTLKAKASDFKGYPLKTSIRILFGGEQCAKAKNAGSAAGTGTVSDASAAAGQAAATSSAAAAGAAATQAASGAAGNSVAGSIFGSAAGAFTNKLASGLFSKKSSTAAPAAPPAEVPANMVQFASITLETTAITSGPVAADQFEVPAGYKLVTPKKAEEKEFNCPTG
ncbi:MAG: hypothetical protein JSR36_12580 [Proteobacteria bacterium]|nr:hypothetical protein [Pseudomonadota bacterium]